MTPHPYRKIAIAFGIALAGVFILNVFFLFVAEERPQLSEEKMLEYQWHLCELQVRTGHPACSINWEVVHAGDLKGLGGIPP